MTAAISGSSSINRILIDVSSSHGPLAPVHRSIAAPERPILTRLLSSGFSKLYYHSQRMQPQLRGGRRGSGRERRETPTAASSVLRAENRRRAGAVHPLRGRVPVKRVGGPAPPID